MTKQRIKKLLLFFGLSEADFTDKQLKALSMMSAKDGERWLKIVGKKIRDLRVIETKRIFDLKLIDIKPSDVVHICNNASRGEQYKLITLLIDQCKDMSNMAHTSCELVEKIAEKINEGIVKEYIPETFFDDFSADILDENSSMTK